MENTVIYILGLFEEGNDPLFYNIRCFLQRNNCNVHGIELYSKNSFGSYAFDEEIGRITSEINKFRPALVVAHSLGAYVCLQLPISCPLVLLDPSIEIRKIIKSNSKQIGSKYIYDDGINKSILSKEFIRSISIAPSIQKLARYTESKHIYIFGAGKGGWFVAEQYHRFIPQSQYTLLPNADHAFSNKVDQKKIFTTIKHGLRLSQAGN